VTEWEGPYVYAAIGAVRAVFEGRLDDADQILREAHDLRNVAGITAQIAALAFLGWDDENAYACLDHLATEFFKRDLDG